MLTKTLPRASARALLGAAAAGSAVGLGLAGAYLAGASTPATLIHSPSQALASAAARNFSDAALQQNIAQMPPGAQVIAKRHDPFFVANAVLRDRQAAEFAARLQRADFAPTGPTVASLMLRPSLGVGRFDASSRFDLSVADALDSARDLECLTQAVYYEARGESAEGQRAVAQVVLNRVHHPAFPKTVCAVVFQGAAVGHGCQFSFACDGSMHDRREPAAWRRAETVAARALGGVVMASVGKSTHFHAVGYGSQWDGDMIRVAQVGMHIFFRFGRGGPAAMHLPADGLQTAQAAASTPVPQPGPVLASLLPPSVVGGAAASTRAEAKAAPAPKESQPQSAPNGGVQPTSGPAPAPAKTDAPTA
ncbi:MAG TPA: cell wall hydrolase [Caulobacteraceae bacterium]|nr:cell wall hydrolase [Caulobacteraceae bacterium]